MPNRERTHKLQLESVTLNFRLWDGAPAKKEGDGARYRESPEYSTGRPFATVEVHRLGTYIRTLNERTQIPPAIQRSITAAELTAIAADIEAAAYFVLRAGILDPVPNPPESEPEEGEEEEHRDGHWERRGVVVKV